MWKVKNFFKNIWRYFSFAIGLPHIWITLILLISAIASLVLSFTLENDKVTSVFSNVFAGLITDTALCLISGLICLTSYSIKGKIEWLEKLHDECIEFMHMHLDL